MGVTFSEALGKNDGSVKGIRYFDCEANCGLFVRASQISRVISSGITSPSRCCSHVSWLLSDIAQVRAAMGELAQRAEELEAHLARVIETSTSLPSDAHVHTTDAPPATHRGASDGSDAADKLVTQVVSRLECTAFRSLEARIASVIQKAVTQAIQELVDVSNDLQKGKQIASSDGPPQRSSLKAGADVDAAMQEATTEEYAEPGGVKLKARRELLMAVDRGELGPAIQEVTKSRIARPEGGPKAKAKRLILEAYSNGLLNMAVDNAVAKELEPRDGGAKMKARHQLLAGLHNGQLSSAILETRAAALHCE